MGQCSPTICSQHQQEYEPNPTPLAFQYGEDVNEPVIEHKDELLCRAPECQQILNDCQNSLRDTGRLYKDPSTNTEPIILRSMTSEQGDLRCTFERPHAFLNDPSDLSKGKSRMYQIVDVGDSSCRQITIRDQVMQPFGVLLCFLAEHPQLIPKIIMTDTNSYGISVVRMNVNGKKELVYIDDYMLCLKKIPLFSQPIRGTFMWPCLLEKAWFKVKGYIDKKIEKNSPISILKSFLSYPINTYYLQDGDQERNKKLLQNFLYHLEDGKGYIVSSRVAPPHKIGLSGKKHFYLMKVIDFEGRKLFYMRNACQNFDFRGAHRILSQELQQKLKDEVQNGNIDDGNFLLDEAQFFQQVQSFSIIEFNKHSQDIIEESISLAVNEETFIMMDLKRDSVVSLSFEQHKEQNLDFLPLSFLVVRISDNILISDNDDQASNFGAQNTIFFRGVYKDLKAGQYLIRLKKKLYDIKLAKKYSNPDKIVITSQVKVKLDYKQIGLMDKQFKTFLLETGRDLLKERMMDSRKQLTHTGVEYVDFMLGDLAIVYFEKTSKTKKEVRVEVKFMGLQNMECISHVVGSGYKALDPISDNEVMVFERMISDKAAKLGQFILDTY